MKSRSGHRDTWYAHPSRTTSPLRFFLLLDVLPLLLLALAPFALPASRLTLSRIGAKSETDLMCSTTGSSPTAAFSSVLFSARSNTAMASSSM